jgi:hypothetical protein
VGAAGSGRQPAGRTDGGGEPFQLANGGGVEDGLWVARPAAPLQAVVGEVQLPSPFALFVC